MVKKKETSFIKTRNSLASGILGKFRPVDRSLGLLQKILLMTDGTVTNIVELYTGEDIKVKKIKQKMILSSENEAFLCGPEIPILKRSILLCGKKQNYIYAESAFIFERLSRSTQYNLLETDIPIGLLWREEKLEMYREIIGCDYEKCGSLSCYFSETDPNTPLLSRTYIVYTKYATLGIISEKFPSTYFKEDFV